MTDEGDDIDELREQTRGADRISAVSDGEGDEEVEVEPTDEETDETGGDGDAEKTETGPTPSEGFGAAFADRAERTRAGVDPRSVSADDGRLSALLLALQDTGEIDDVGEAVREGVGAEAPPEYDRDAVVRLALTYALREEAPAYFDELVGR
jgi:hypothetical protein